MGQDHPDEREERVKEIGATEGAKKESKGLFSGRPKSSLVAVQLCILLLGITHM